MVGLEKLRGTYNGQIRKVVVYSGRIREVVVYS